MSAGNECIHHLDLCDKCGGLQVATLFPIHGVVEGAELTGMDGSRIKLGNGTRLYFGPTPEPCTVPADPQ